MEGSSKILCLIFSGPAWDTCRGGPTLYPGWSNDQPKFWGK